MGLYDTLFPWQKNIVDKFKDRDSYGLFLDCGLGKTLVSLAFAEVNQCTKIIVVTINSKATEDINVRGGWLWWANKANIKYNFYTKKIFNPTKKNPNAFTTETNDMLLLNYESLYSRSKSAKIKCQLKKEIVDFISSCKGHNLAIIIDESHKIKDSSSSQNKCINQMYKLSKLFTKKTYLYLGTGTIFTVGLIDTFAQLKILGWPGTKTEFLDRFCVRAEIPSLPSWQQPIESYKNTDQLYEIIHQYGITIKSEEVIDLPEKIFEDHVYPSSKFFRLLTETKYNQKELYAYMKERGLPYLIDDKIYSSMNIEEKVDYWQRLYIGIIDGKLYLEGKYEIGSTTDSYTETMNYLASIYDNLEDFEGEFKWLYNFNYLFVLKEKEDPVSKAMIKWHEVKAYRPNRKTNNPFYNNFAFPETKWEAETSGAAWMRARQMSSGFQGNAESYQWYDTTRLEMLAQFLEENENNYVLFYNYTPELIAIYEICESLGYKIDVYYGDKKSLTNYEIYENQTEDERFSNTKNIILANFDSGSTGKNWQMYNQCIIFSTPTFDNYEQGIKRIHRTGQNKTCIYHVFYSDNFLDKGMNEALANNGEYNDKMFAADRARINEIMERDED